MCTRVIVNEAHNFNQSTQFEDTSFIYIHQDIGSLFCCFKQCPSQFKYNGFQLEGEHCWRT